jgi:hypothetical protein
VNVLNRIGGTLLLLGLAIAVIIGFQTPTGRRFWDGIWQAGDTVVDYARTQIAGFAGRGTAGNLLGSIGAAAIVLVIVLTLIRGSISVRLYTILLILATILAFILYNPGVVR